MTFHSPLFSGISSKTFVMVKDGNRKEESFNNALNILTVVLQLKLFNHLQVLLFNIVVAAAVNPRKIQITLDAKFMSL